MSSEKRQTFCVSLNVLRTLSGESTIFYTPYEICTWVVHCCNLRWAANVHYGKKQQWIFNKFVCEILYGIRKIPIHFWCRLLQGWIDSFKRSAKLGAVEGCSFGVLLVLFWFWRCSSFAKSLRVSPKALQLYDCIISTETSLNDVVKLTIRIL